MFSLLYDFGAFGGTKNEDYLDPEGHGWAPYDEVESWLWNALIDIETVRVPQKQ